MATAIFPAALIAATNVGGPVVNRQQLTQSGTVDNVNATITATTAIPASWPTNGRVVMENEVVWYAGKSGSTLTGCTRGAENTVAAGHTGVPIEMDFTAEQFNQLLVDIIAVQTKVGADASAVAATHDFKLSEVLTGSSDKAVGKVATQTLTNKTLTSPVINTPTIGTSVTYSAATTDIIPGATSVRYRNNANGATNILINDNGDITLRGLLSGITTLTATTIGGTLSTAAQPNVTSLGTLTALTISGQSAITLTHATARIIPGATSVTFRDTANLNDNLSIANSGDITVRGALTGVTTLTATTVAGTLSTAAQPNVTSLGTLTALSIGGNETYTGASRRIIASTTDWGVRDNANANTNLLITDAGAITVRSTISGITTLTATTLAGTLSTAAQPNVTSVGTLSSLTVSGALTATISTAAQPNITSVGTLTSLTVTGAVTISTGAITVNTAGVATFNRQYYSAAFSVAFSATPTFDFNNGNVQVFGSMTANVTSMTLNNVQPGARYIIFFPQDATGGRTIVWPAAVKWSGGTAPTLSGANKVDMVSLIVRDASNIHATLAGNY